MPIDNIKYDENGYKFTTLGEMVNNKIISANIYPKSYFLNFKIRKNEDN